MTSTSPSPRSAVAPPPSSVAASGTAPGETPAAPPPTEAVPPLAATCCSATLGYGTKSVLADVDLEIADGTITALIGPNGAGKSTLLNALAGLIHPRSGELAVPALGRPGGVALVLQATEANARLPLTVREVVTMGRYPYHRLLGRLTAADRRAIDAALEALDIGDLAGAQLQEISGGQRQRALVAQGLAQEADLLLLDEPYTGLDILSRASIRTAVEGQRSAGRTVVLSTHDIPDAAAADWVVLLAGRVVATGPPGDILSTSCLSAAYGSRLIALEGGGTLLDDPHDH